MKHERINLIGVPIDNISEEELANEILKLDEKRGPKQIMFLSIWDLLHAKISKEFFECIQNAALVLPVSKSLVSGAKFLRFTPPVRHNPCTTIVNIMYALDQHPTFSAEGDNSMARTQGKTLYLLGGKSDILPLSEKNIRYTFSNLRIVGKFPSYRNKNLENDIIEAIYKSEPSLVLISSGINGKACWAFRHKSRFKKSIFIWHKDIISIFANRKKFIDDKSFKQGLEFWSALTKNPLRIFLLIPYFWYISMLVFYKLFRKNV